MDEIKKREEEKRERAWNPVERWKVIQKTIAWAEANLPPEHAAIGHAHTGPIS